MRKLITLVLITLYFPLCTAAQLQADFYANVKSGCAPLVVQFTSTSTGNPTSYQWDLGNNTPVASNNSAPSTTYNTPGTYTVKLKVYNGSASDEEIKTAYIVVHENPVVNFTGSPLSGCPGTIVNFTSSVTTNGTSATYTWYFGDGNYSNATNPGHTYTTSGYKTVQLVVVNNYGCKKIAERKDYVNIYDKPGVNFSASPQDICLAGSNVSFSSSPTGTGPFTYSWKFGDGASSTAANPSHVYTGPAPKTYTVELEVKDGNGCVNKLVKPNYIKLHKNVASFTCPTFVCVGTPVIFTNTSTNPSASPSWHFGISGATSSDISPTYTYTTPGTYTVKLTTDESGCTSQASKTIVVYPLPVANFTIDPDPPCPAPITLAFIPNKTYAGYYWNFGDPNSGSNTSSASNPSHTYNENKGYIATLVVTDSNGCKDTVLKPVYIYDLFDSIDVDKKEGCIPLTVTFKAFALTTGHQVYPYPVSTYSWDFGDNTTPVTTSSQVVQHTYTSAGVYRVINTIITSNGCTVKDTIYIRAGTKPTPSLIAPSRVCHNQVIQFNSTTPNPVNGWVWIYGDGSIDTGISDPKHQYKPGEFTLKYVALYNGCPSDTVYKNIIIDSPDAQFGFKMSCAKDSLKYVWFKNGSVGATSWIWYFGDGDTSTALDPLHVYAANGAYSAKLVAHNSRSNCYDTIIQVVKIIDPYATLQASDTAVCRDEPIYFLAALNGSVPQSYSWQCSKGLINPPAPGTSCTIKMLDTGIHAVKVTIVDENGCSHVAIRDIFVSSPIPKFGGSPLSACVPLTVQFTDTSIAFRRIIPIVQRKWDFGNGSTLSTTDTTTSSVYYIAGAYDIKLVVTDSLGCTDSLTKLAYINAYKPLSAFTLNDRDCVGAPLSISNTSSNATNYNWDFGNGDTSVVAQPTPKYANPGTYTITLIAKDTHGCSDTSSKSIAIQKPTALFSMTDSLAVCPPLSVKFILNSTGISSQLWKVDHMNYSSLKTPSKLFLNVGKHPVTLVVADSLGCQDSLTKYVDILGYTGGFSYTPLLGCVPLEVTLTSTITNVPYVIWDFGDGHTANATSGTTKHIYSFAGAFVPKMIFTDGKGCTSTNPGPDTIKVDEAIAAFTSSPLCEYSDVMFIDSSYSIFSKIVSTTWIFHDGKISYSPAPSHYYGPPGQYNIRLIVMNGNGCTDTLQKDITIHPSPEIDAGADTVICLKDSATLYPSGGVSYEWTPVNFLSCSKCTNPKAAPPKRFIYTVEGTDIYGCKNTDTVEVDIKTKVVAVVGQGGAICQLDTIGLHAFGAVTYEWTPPTGLNNPKIPDPVASPEQTTNYTVFSYEGSCIPDTDQVLVTVYPLPTVEARGTQTIIAGSSADIQASGTLITRFAWSPSESLSCSDCSAPTASPTKTTTYTITAYTNHGCVDSDKVTITVLCDESQVFVPNTFTPNGDGQNDRFYPRGNGLENVESFRIYNRWGELVFERRGFSINDENSGWDGTFRGAALPPDVYVYTLFVYCDSGELMKLKGDITLIR